MATKEGVNVSKGAVMTVHLVKGAAIAASAIVREPSRLL